MSTVRLRRLTADHESLEQYVRLHPRVKLVAAEGEPPERYQLEYRIRSLRQVGDDLREVKSHMVEIVLPRNYPRTPPQCRMLSPVFHPNIAPHAICVGDHWSAGESLKSIVVRIGEMLAYQTYNIKSPLNGEAARWVEENEDQLPLDEVSLLPEEPGGAETETVASKPARPPVRPSVFDEDEDEDEDEEPIVQRRPVKPKESTQASGGRKPPDSRAGTTSPSRQESDDEDEEKPQTPKAVATPIRIDIACLHCGMKYQVPIEYRGKKVKCKACQESFVCP